MAKLFNRAKMTTSTTGSGTVTLGSASVGYQSFADAGVSNGDVVQYVIEEGGNFEIGTGTYSATGTSLTRSPTESSNSNAAISLGGAATVSITAVADDLNRLQHEGSTKVEPTSTGATVTGNLAVTGTVDGRDVAADGAKLDNIEANATADQTAAEIRALVESATDSNVFTDADHTKLNGIESGATADQTASEILTAIKTVDGTGSGLDADTLDGSHASAFLTGNQTITLSGDATGSGTTSISVSLAADSVGASEIAANAVGASELNVSGNGTTSQFLRSDGDGTFTWATPTDTNTTYSAGSGLSLSGTTFSNSAPDQTVTLTGSGATSISGTYPNFTISSTDTNTNTTYSAGSGLSLSGTTFSHTDTSSQASVNNSGRTYIQDITLDGYGHVTAISSATETVTNTDTTYSAGSNLFLSGTQFNVNSSPSFNSVLIGSTVTLQESTDRADLLQITSSTSSWGGLQIRNSSNEGRWSFMTDGDVAGIYNDEDNQWHVLWNEQGNTEFYHNGTVKATISSTDWEMSQRLDMNNYDIYGVDQIAHHGDTNTYMQFHASDQWRVVVGGSERLEVKNSSPHVLVSGDLNSTSDERLKDNIKPITNALSDVTQLEGVSFDWKDTGTRGHGFIAQQVEPILPDVVQTDEETGIKSINYVGMIGHLVEAIKELKAEIEELKR
jgi:hypothetical protein